MSRHLAKLRRTRAQQRAMAERRYDPKRGKREMAVYRELMGDDKEKDDEK
jgi:hypothetical protein